MKKKLKLLITISMASFALASNVKAASGTDGITTTGSVVLEAKPLSRLNSASVTSNDRALIVSIDPIFSIPSVYVMQRMASGWRQQPKLLLALLTSAVFSVAAQWPCTERGIDRLFAAVRWQGAA